MTAATATPSPTPAPAPAPVTGAVKVPVFATAVGKSVGGGATATVCCAPPPVHVPPGVNQGRAGWRHAPGRRCAPAAAVARRVRWRYPLPERVCGPDTATRSLHLSASGRVSPVGGERIAWY